MRLVLLALTCVTAFAQTPTARPEFEVASVKPGFGPDGYSAIKATPGGRFTVENLPLKYLIGVAYEVKGPQILNGPGWIETMPFDISGKAEGSPTLPEMLPLLRSLLADRFKLTIHRATKQLSILALTVAKGQGKLVKSSVGGCGSATTGLRSIMDGLTGTEVSMNDLAKWLSVVLATIVIDRTGLPDKYDVHLEWSPDPSRPGWNGPGASIFTDLQEQLGLKLESQKAPVEVLVIEHIEKPTEN